MIRKSILLLTVASLVAASAFAEIIPAARRPLAWNAGVPGGIPVYPVQINVKNAPYNAVGNGVADDTAALQAAINACTNGNAVYIPPGTYRTTAQLNVNDKSIVIRGAGPTQTKLIYDTATPGSVFKLFHWSTNSSPINVLSGCTKDSTSITVADASTVAVGDIFTLSQLNSAPLSVNQGYSTPITWGGEIGSQGNRVMVQFITVAAKSGNTLTLSRPLYFTFDLANVPQIKEIAMIKRAGVEDLYITRSAATSDYQASSAVMIDTGYQCWVKNIESYKTDGTHVRVTFGYQCEVRDNYAHEGYTNISGHNYGMFMFGPNTDNLVENNIVWKARHSLIFEGGGSGCVYGYNYCQDVFGGEDPQFLHGDMDTHGAHPYMNLFESNVFSKLAHDNTFGSSSHNTTFRCNITRWSANATRGFAAVVIEATSHDQNLVGNVLGKPGISGVYEITSDPGSAQGIYKMGYDSPGGIGSPVSSMPANTVYRHGNFDYITNTTKWETSNPDHTIPASLYLSSKPAFFGSNPWPAIGSDLTPMVSKLPAQIRFEQIQAGGVVAPSNAAIIIQTSP